MPIVPSRSARTQELLGRLASASAAERDSAIAGLTLLGARVVLPLGAFLPTASRAARLAALEVLERIDDRAALPLILDLARDGDDTVALRAIEVAGSRSDGRAVGTIASLLAGRDQGARRRAAALALLRLQDAGLVEALDPLAGRLLDEGEEAGLRLAILDGLLAQPPALALGTIRPLLKKLAASSNPELAARAGGSRRRAPSGRPTESRGQAVEARLVEELVAPERSAAAVAGTIAALARIGARAIPALSRALERLGPVRPGASASSLRARAAIHEALAALDSRAALYDLRETIESSPPEVILRLIQVGAQIGDVTLVPALARAATEQPALRAPCRDAFASIALRERLRRTSASLKAVRPAHRSELDGFFRSLGRRRR